MLLVERGSENLGEELNISITVVRVKLDDGTLLSRAFPGMKKLKKKKHNPYWILTEKSFLV